MGVEETSFPMFLSSKSLEKEKGRPAWLEVDILEDLY